MSRIEPIRLSSGDRDWLEKLVRDRNTPQKVVWRSRIVLLSAEGLRPPAIAGAVGKSELTVRRWRRRFVVKGVEGLLKDATRPPGNKPLPPEKIKQVVELTLHEKPPGRTRWSERSMAAKVGIAPSTVHNIWKALDLEGTSAEAAFDADLQAVARPGLRREGARCRRALHQSTG